MTTFFVSRHPGAKEWACLQRLQVDVWVAHLNTDQVHAGDTVIGTLPIDMAACVCGKGAHYLHLAISLPAHARGKELSAADITRFGAHLQAYNVCALN